MQVYSYSETRNRLKAIMDIVCKDGETVIVTRKDGQNVVMLSLDDFNAGRFAAAAERWHDQWGG